MKKPISIHIGGKHNKDVIGCNTIAEVVPGWILVQCHTQNSMLQGQYGLYNPTGDSPSDSEVAIRFPIGHKFLDDYRNFTDEELNECNPNNDAIFWMQLQVFEAVLVLPIETGFSLYNSCIQAGYNPNSDGTRIGYWLSQRIGEIIEFSKVRMLPC